MKSDIRTLVEKWEKAPEKVSAKGVEDLNVRDGLVQLLENQDSISLDSPEGVFSNPGSLLKEDLSGAPGATTDGSMGYTGSDNVYANDPANVFRPVSMALVRRTFPDLFAHKCAGVQAMGVPYGVAFAMRMVYAGTDVEAGWDNVDEYSGYSGHPGSAHGATADYDTGKGLNSYGGYDQVTGDGITGDGEGLVVPDWRLDNNGIGNASAAMKQLEVKLAQRAIHAQTRKIASSYSIEAAQDIKAMHNIDIEREIVGSLDYEVKAELDRQILQAMKTVAEDESANVGGKQLDTVDLASGADKYGRYAAEVFATIASVIIAQANNLAITTRRGAGNFAVVSPDIATALQGLGHMFVNYDASVNPAQTVAYLGKLNGMIDVYRDQYARESYALIGYKGNGISDAGVIYSPYLMGVTNRAVSPADFSPRIAVMSRYAITNSLLGAGRYYRIVRFKNLNAFLPTAGQLPITVGTGA